MKNRITRRRLSDFLSYEWIAMIVVVVVSIIFWELIFTMTSVAPNVGQEFKIIYDEGVERGSQAIVNVLYEGEGEDKKFALSFDVFEINTETMSRGESVLNDRLSVQECDILITDCIQPDEDAEFKDMRLKLLVDKEYIYNFNELYNDALTYLSQYFKEGVDANSFVLGGYKISDLDESKIDEVFRERLAKDNRFRTEAQKKEGFKMEMDRIEKLCVNVKRFRYLLDMGDEYFFMYTKYEQSVGDDLSEETKELREHMATHGPQPYGLRADKLTGSENHPSNYFKLYGTDSVENVIVTAINFKSYQPHLQYETLAFINSLVLNCSNFYNGI